MSRRRAKSPGWAALHLHNTSNQLLQPRINTDPFPSLPTTTSSLNPCNSLVKNNQFSDKSLASTALPTPVSFLNPVEDRQANVISKSSNWKRLLDNNNCQEKGYNTDFEQLKVLYSWAEDSLIEDILAAVDNNFEEASSSLKAMFFDNDSENGSNLKRDVPDGRTFHANVIVSSKTKDPAKPSSKVESLINEKLNVFSSNVNSVQGQLTRAPPIEPEWEEDDVYLNHRKDAIKIIRAASRHSKAAANSFLRGDHSSARHLSQKAQEEWEAADKLNQKAATEILSIQNSRNGMWKLDLHGLHAVEAVQALRERLDMIETQVLCKTEASHGLSFLTVSEMKSSIEPPLIRHKPVSLEVITGIGNHSRGEAAIPTVIKSFLVDNAYRHDEARPGVIMVRTKFRCREKPINLK